MAKVNIIENFRVTEKRNVTIPETVRGFVRCVNPKCITNNEPVETSFTVIREGEQIALRCKYCEKIYAPAADRDSEISRPAVSPENTAAGNSELTFLYRFSSDPGPAIPAEAMRCHQPAGNAISEGTDGTRKKPH